MEAIGIGGPAVDPDHPWLGLHPFSEEDQQYFFGRTVEIRDIFLRVREEPLTVLYAESGLGKTSLLRAGLMPKLRIEGFRPVRLLLDFSVDSGSLIAQVRAALAEACADGKSPDALLDHWAIFGSLWEIYAHEELRPSDLAKRPPVLIFDQFEEVFTLGEEHHTADDPRCAEVAELFTQLADLVENRAPAAVQRAFEVEPQRALDYEFGPTRARVVLTLREDYLAQLEKWKAMLPSLMRNRMPLRLLSGTQALEAIVRPGRMEGRNLVSEEVGTQIVRFVARQPVETPLEQIEAVPPLVSLLCERLNDARLAQEPKLEHVTAALVNSQGTNILQRFYAQSFEPFQGVVREAVREYVEDRMVTVGGHRNPVAREDACAELLSCGVRRPEEILDALIARRLLTAEQRGGIQRLEITHDVLCPLVVAARNDRYERRAGAELGKQRRALRRARQTTLAFALLSLVALGALAAAVIAWSRAEAAKEAADESERVAVSSLNAQLRMFTEPIALAGEMAAAVSNRDRTKAYIALDKLARSYNPFVRTVSIDVALGDLSVAFSTWNSREEESWNPEVEQSTERVRQAILQFAMAVRKGWESQSLEGKAKSLTLDLIVRPTYERAILVTGGIGNGALQPAQKDEFEKLYWSDLVFLETKDVEEKMVAFRRKLRGNPEYEQDDLKKIAADLKEACDRAMLKAQGDLKGVLNSYRDSLGIAEKLAKQDPNNAVWQSDLAWIYWRTGIALAEVEPKSQNEAGAMVAKGLDILRQLKERKGLTTNQNEWLHSIEADLRKMKEMD